MADDKITIPQMINMAHSHYELIGSRNATREAIIRDLKRQGVYDKNVVRNGDKLTHYFDQTTVEKTLFFNLKKYFSKRAGKAWQRALELNRDFENNPPDSDDYSSVYEYYQGGFQKKLNDVMLTAIFNKFFDIDKDSLLKDLLSTKEASEGSFSPAQAAAYDRTVTIEAIIQNYVTEK